MRSSRGWCVVALLGLVAAGGCGRNEPFTYRSVRGTVKYDDASLIQANRLEVTFHPQAPPRDPKTHPRPGVANVDVVTGTIEEVTSHRYNDGIVAGEHKVTVHTYGSDGLPTDTLRDEYTDASTTPLRYHTSDGQAVIRLKKK